MSFYREPFLIIVTGKKGVGKTYTTLQEIHAYVAGDASINRSGRPVIVFDVNNEYTNFQILPYHVDEKDRMRRTFYIRKVSKNFYEKKIAKPYRILPFKGNGDKMSITELITTSLDLAHYFRGGLVLYEDINRYMIDTKFKDFVGMLIGLRHQDLDCIVHLQSMAKVTTTFWQNLNYLRLHKQTDEMHKYKDRIPNYELVKIADIIVDKHYMEGDIRYYCYVSIENNTMAVSPEDFEYAAKRYLAMNQRTVREEMAMDKLSYDQAVSAWINRRKGVYLR